MKSQTRIFFILLAFVLTAVSIVALINVDTNTLSITGYGKITFQIFDRSNVCLYVEESLSYTNEQIQALYSKIQESYRLIDDRLKRSEKVKILVIADPFILGADGASYQQEGVLCTPDAIDSGTFHASLAGAYLNTTEIWKQLGAWWYVSGEAPAYEQDLTAYYLEDSNLPVLTLFNGFFMDTFSDTVTQQAAQETAHTLSQFVIANYGFDAFLQADLTDYRQAWLDSVACQQVFVLSYDLTWLQQASYTSEFQTFPLIIHTGNRSFYLNSIEGSMDEAAEVLFWLSCGMNQVEAMMANIKASAPTQYSAVQKSYADHIDYYITNTEVNSRADCTERIVYLQDPASLAHETVHILTMDETRSYGNWIAEGLAQYFAEEVSPIDTPQKQRMYASFTDTYPVGTPLASFVEEVNARYHGLGGSYESLDQFDYAKLLQAIAYVTIQKPAYKESIRFPYATNALYEQSPLYDSLAEGNLLTYPESYLFVRYLITEYGLDAVLNCCRDYDFEKVFGKSFDDVLLVWQAHL